MSLFRATAISPERLQPTEAQTSGSKGTSTLKKLKHRARASLSGLFEKANGEEALAAQGPTSQSQGTEITDRPHTPVLSSSVRKRFTSLSCRLAAAKLSPQSDARDSKISVPSKKQEEPEKSSPIPIPAPIVNVAIPSTRLGPISDWGFDQPNWEQPHGQQFDSAYGSTVSPAPHIGRPRLYINLSGSPKDFKPDATPTPMPGTTFPLEVNPIMTPKSSMVGVPPALKEQERALAALKSKPRLSIDTNLACANGNPTEAKLADKLQQLAMTVTSPRDYYGTNNFCSEDLFAPAPTPVNEIISPTTSFPGDQAVVSAILSPEEEPPRRLRVCNPDPGFEDEEEEQEVTVPSPASTESDSEYFHVPDPEARARDWEERIRAKYSLGEASMAAHYAGKRDSTAPTSIHNLGMLPAYELEPETTKKPTDPYLEKLTPPVEGEQPRYWWW